MKISVNSAWLEQLEETVTQQEGKHAGPGAAIRIAAKTAVVESLSPELPVNTANTEINVRVMSSEKWLSNYQRDFQLTSSSDALIGGANAFLLQHNDSETTAKVASENNLLPLPGMECREQQVTLADFLTHEQAQGLYRFCEASTGIGKGLALVASAIQSKQLNPDKQVIVAAPTIAILNQLYADYCLFEREYGLTYQAVKSQSSAEFLSKRLSLYWCEEYADHPQRQPFYEAINDSDTLSVSAFDAFDSVPLSELTVFHDTIKDDPGYYEYEQAKELIKGADIVFCTHSLVALSGVQGKRSTKSFSLEWDAFEVLRNEAYQTTHVAYPYYYFDNRKRIDSSPESASGFFAPAPLLFIDEAHLFPDMVSLMVSSSIPLAGLERAMKNYRKGSAQKVRSILERLMSAVPADIDNTIALRNTSSYPQLRTLERELNDALQQFVKSYSRSALEKTLNGRDLLRYAQTLKQLSNESHSVTLKASPVKKYLRIESGSGAKDAIIDFIVYASAGMSFTSATLHIPFGGSSLNGYSFSAANLNTPFDKVVTHPPLHSKWLAENVRLTLPESHESFDPSSESYISNCENEIKRITNDTDGGTMVLCTSYEQIEKLELRLASPRVIAQRKGQSVRMLANTYLERYKAGGAPIWLATGAAWTGIDITDKEVRAENDAAIQNLIIMKLPFEQPAGHNKVNYNELIARCLFRLKQGIGRLVRRPGRKGMTLTILDGRLCQPRNSLFVIRRYLVSTYN